MDASTRRPHGLWHLLLHRRVHPTMQKRIVDWGYGTSVVFTILIFLNILIPSYLGPFCYWIGLVYLMFQLAEIAVRDPLDMGEVMEDHVFSAVPAILALVLAALHLWSKNGIFTAEGLRTLYFFLAVAWTDFIFGLWISMRILSTPYRRDESRAPHS